MREDYQPYMKQLMAALFDIGAVLLEESELSAKFLLSSGWVLIFDCEKHYGPSWTITVKRSIDENGFAIWILMVVFESLTGKKYGKPTIENQVNFLKTEGAKIFGDIDFYENEYDRINEA